MQPVAAALAEDDMRRLARHYSEATPPAAPLAPADAEKMELGRRIAMEGVPDRQVAPCQACHGLENGPQNRLFPALAGQYADFIELQLRLWKQGKRGGGAFSEIMEPIVSGITEAEIEAVAAFYASLQPTREGSAQTARQ
jgi:cytochrome c553